MYMEEKPINPQPERTTLKNEKQKYPLQIYPNMSCREEKQTTALKELMTSSHVHSANNAQFSSPAPFPEQAYP
jgi:hypothetical protein